MNIRIKLTLTFIVLSFFVLIPVINNTHMMVQVEKAMTLRNLVQELATNIRHEEINAISYVTEKDENLEKKVVGFNDDFEKNKNLISKLEDLVSSEKELDLLEQINKWHDELRDIFGEVRAVREEKIAKEEEIRNLSTEIKDKRHEIREEYFPRKEFQHIISTPIDFEFQGVRYRYSIAYVFKNLEYSEKEFLWQYRNDVTRKELIKNIGMFKTVVEMSELSDETKNIFLTVVGDYTFLLARMEKLIDPDSIEILIQRKYIDAENLEDLSHHFYSEIFDFRKYGSLLEAPVRFEHGGEKYFESLSFVVLTMRYREKEYLWQENSEARRKALYEEIGKFSAIFIKLDLPQDVKRKAGLFLSDYQKLVEELNEINNKIEMKIEETTNRQTRMISELSGKADMIQNGGKPGLNKGIDGLIYLSEINMNEQVRRSVATGRSVGIIVVLTAIIIGLIVSNAIAGPVLKLKKAADEIGKGNLNIDPDIKTKDEIGELAKSFVMMARDLKLSQSEVLKSENKYRTLFESSPDPIMIIGVDGKILDCNKSALDLISQGREDVTGRYFYELDLMSDDEFIKSTKMFSRFVKGSEEKIKDTELEMIIDGKKRWLQISGAPIWNTGKVEALQIIGRDITGKQSIMLELDEHRSNLEEMVEQRTTALKKLNMNLRVNIEERKVAEERLKKSEYNLRMLAQKIISMQEEERTRLARDLHDLMGQQLSAMGIEIDWLKKLKELTPDHLEPLGERMEKINIDLQAIYRGLRPMELEKLGLSTAMSSLVWDTEKRVSYKITSDIEIIKDKISSEKEISLYRILQEMLTNVIRHSEAKHVSISFKKEGTNLILRVEDDGKGFDMDDIGKDRSFGLAGMKERAFLCGGDLKIESESGKGSLIEVIIPV